MGGGFPTHCYVSSPPPSQSTENIIIFEKPDIQQYDGNVSISSNSDVHNISSSSISSSSSSSCTEYSTDDEAFPEPIPVNLYRVPGQDVPPDQPIRLDVNLNQDLTTPLPLCLLFNARSVWNKSDNLIELLNQSSPDHCGLRRT